MIRTVLIACFAVIALSMAAEQRECFMLQPLDRPDEIYVSDEKECDVAAAPASTFKIPHALIALETGVVKDPHARVAYDGTPQPFPSWEKPHSLDSSVKWSVFWFYRRTAALIGRERMVANLKKIAYARDTFDDDVTLFWTNGDLVVTPREQLAFMRRMMRYELPVKRRNADIVKEAMLMPAGKITNAAGIHDFAIRWPKNAVVRAKTGNTTTDGERVSWLIGHLQAGKREYVFVGRVRAKGSLPTTAGADVARRMLNRSEPFFREDVRHGR